MSGQECIKGEEVYRLRVHNSKIQKVKYAGT